MNASKRLILGVISTLLLAAGFARAADRLDPMNQAVYSPSKGIVLSDGTPTPPPPCVGGGDGGDGYN